MRTIYRHAYRVQFKRPPGNDRWLWQEYQQLIRDAEDWCEEHAKGDWSHRDVEPSTFWFDKADDAIMCKLMHAGR